MTPDQTNQLLNLLAKIADGLANQSYTITGAADWPILLAVGGIAAGLIACMWYDLKGTIKDSREEWRDELQRHKIANERAHENIWQAMRDCQTECCPRRKE